MKRRQSGLHVPDHLEEKEMERREAIQKAVRFYGGQDCPRCRRTWPRKWPREGKLGNRTTRIRFQSPGPSQPAMCPECYTKAKRDGKLVRGVTLGPGDAGPGGG